MDHWSRLALFIVPEMSCVTLVGGKGGCIGRLDNAVQEELVGPCVPSVSATLYLLDSRI